MTSGSDRAPSARRTAAITAGAGLAVVLVLGLLVRLAIIEREVDAEWMEEVLERRAPAWEAIARVFDFVGGGWFAIWLVPVLVAVVFVILKRPWSALLFLLGSAVSSLLVQLLKRVFARARPEDILLDLASGSYPSGHVANAATIAVLLALLLARWWVLAPGLVYTALMALSRTYLGAHWVTDTVGGALLGAAAALGAWAVFAPRLRSEGRGPAASVGA